MQYSVPQFIEVEDKIIGPLTIKQFLYILGGVGVLFVVWILAPSIQVFLVPAVPILGLFLALAFYKVNGRPFVNFLQASVKYFIHPKVRLWQREFTESDIRTDFGKKRKEKKDLPEVGKKVPHSRLQKLSNILDTEGGVDEAIYEIREGDEVDLEDFEKRDAAGMTAEEREERVNELLGKK